MLKLTKFVNNPILRKFSTNQKIINGINKSANTLPRLNPFEQLLKIIMSTVNAPLGIC